MDDTAFRYLGAGVAMIGALGGGIGLGMIFAAWITAMARNPSGEDGYRTIGLIGAAFAEFVFLGCLVVACLLLFVMK